MVAQQEKTGKEENMCDSTMQGYSGCCGGMQHGHGFGQGHAHGMPFRHFMSREERKEYLQHYEDELKKELSGVEDRIKEIENS